MLGGVVAGVELSGPGTLSVIDDGVEVRDDGGEIIIGSVAMDGVTYRDARLTLHLSRGDIVYADGTPRLAAVAREIMSQVCTLPELTRPLRALGSRRAVLGAEHDRFFAPLLAARRRGERAADLRGRLRAFDAPAMRTALDETIAAFAKTRYPRSAPDRRALEAELLEIAAPLHAALTGLEVYASRTTEVGTDETAFVRWRSWCGAVQEVFDRADRCWMEFGAVLGAVPPRRRPLWRRVLRLGVVALTVVGAEADDPARRWSGGSREVAPSFYIPA
jgi:hypothetical protein